MKKYSDDLHRLIMAMTRSEKRFFRIFSLRHTTGNDNMYLRLFDTIEKDKSYDEDEIRKALARDGMVKNLDVKKVYLYNAILRSLRIFHSEQTVKQKINNGIHSAEILFFKGLHDQSRKIAEKTKKTAYAYGFLPQALDVIHLEKIQQSAGDAPADISRNLDETMDVIGQIRNAAEYEKIVNRIYQLYIRHGIARNKKKQRIFLPMIREPMLQDENMARSFESKVYYFHALFFLNHIRSDLKGQYHYQQKLISLLESEPEILSARPFLYAKSLNSFLITLLSLGNFDEFWQVLKKYRAMHVYYGVKRNHVLNALVFFNSCINEMEAHILLGDFHKTARLVTDMEKQMDMYKNYSFSQEGTLNYYIAYASFGNGSFRLAEGWLLKNVRRECYAPAHIHSISRILLLIVQYELKNFTEMDYHLLSTYRFLAGKDQLTPLEREIIRFIKKESANMVGEKEQRKALDSFRQVITWILKKRGEEVILSYFDFAAWVESKIEKKPFSLVMKEKAAGRFLNRPAAEEKPPRKPAKLPGDT